MNILVIKETDTFRKWRKLLRDNRVSTLIASRLDRLRYGHVGDVKSVGNGISELRIHHGPGYRLYFRREGDTIIVMLCGGDKNSQFKDIAMAKRLTEMGDPK